MTKLIFAAVCIALGAFGMVCLTRSETEPTMAPEFPKDGHWLQSKPLSISSLRGRVIVLHFWTRDCVNCRHNYVVYKRWQEQYADKALTIIGVHTPEFDNEADPAGVQHTLEKQGLKYAVVLDNDKQIWNGWKNQYWPCLYLIDKKGRVRYQWDGELHLDSALDRRFAAHIDELLAEAP